MKVIFCLLCVLLSYGRCQLPCILYGLDSPNIQCLQNKEVFHVITDSESAWMIEFYAHWCPHCQNFAKPFKSLANSLLDWSPVVKVGVFDCAQSYQHYIICQKFHIRGFPTIRFFRPHDTTPLRYDLKLEGVRGHREIKYQLILHLMSVFPKPNHWPNLGFKETNIILKSQQPRVLVFEDNTQLLSDGTGFLGAVLALDFMKLPKIKIFRISATNKEMVGEYNVSKFPSVIVVKENDICHVQDEPQEELEERILDCIYG